jgi:hypothetical protein
LNLPHVGLLLLAQTPPPASPSATTAPADAVLIPILALKRWFGSVTLASPIGTPSKVALWAWLAGLGVLLLMAILAQGPVKAFAQFLDLAGLSRLVSLGIGRLKRSGRLVAIVLAATVVSWTAWQTPLHNVQEKKEDLALLLKSKSRTEFAGEQGTLAALTPLRDLMDMGDNLVLLVGAAALVFKFSADRWGRFDDPSVRGRAAGGWTTLCWGGAGLYAMYRVAGLIKDIEGLPPLGGCLFIEVGAVPLLMLLADGLLLAWVLVELRGVAIREEDSGFDVAGTIAIVPAAILACLVGLPARYAATTVGLAVFHDHLPKAMIGSPWILTFLRGWGLVWLQAASLPCVGIVGAVAWSSGSWGNALKGYGRLLKAEGGRLVALMTWTGLAVGATSMLAYYAILAMPVQPWVLLAADSYAHYASLPIGLISLAALVELGSRSAVTHKIGRVHQEDGMLYVGDKIE